MTNRNEPINSIADLNNHPSDWYGLTKREYFAAIAVQGMLSSINQSYGKPNVNEASMEDSLMREQEFINDVAIKAVRYSDALIKALNEGGQGEKVL